MPTKNSDLPVIMVIDDNKMMRKFLDSLFNKEYNPMAYENAKAALERLKEGLLPALILVDINMPEMSGIQFLEEVKKHPFLKDIPVVMLSGNQDSKDKIECLEKGAADYLTKPFSPVELKLRISKLALKESHIPKKEKKGLSKFFSFNKLG